MTTKKIATILREKAVNEGILQTKIPFLTLCHFQKGSITLPKTEQPYLYFVAQGSMRLYTPSGILDYVAGQFSISAIDTPQQAKNLTPSSQDGFYALSISFSPEDVLGVMIGLDSELTRQIADGSESEAVITDADRQIVHSVHNLLDLLSHPAATLFVANNIRREIIYYALCGSSGKQFLQSIIGFHDSKDIYEINTWIKKNFRDKFSVEDLAERGNISVSLLRQKFKSAVGMGVLQCQKRLRLTEARRLMLDDGKNVTVAAYDVGYESLSQFIREYKKMFGYAPKEDIQKLKEQLAK